MIGRCMKRQGIMPFTFCGAGSGPRKLDVLGVALELGWMPNLLVRTGKTKYALALMLKED